MTQPHKHAALIHAWADGADIEQELFGGTWIDSPCPSWNLDISYRIKLRVEQRRYRVALFKSGEVIWVEAVETQIEADNAAGHKDFHSWLTDWVTYEVEVQS